MIPFMINWEAPEFEHRPKSVSWYWLSIIGATSLLGFAVFQKNFLFFIFVIVAEILVLILSNREPELIPFELTHDRLVISNRTKYFLNDIRHFSIEPHDETDWPIIAFTFDRRFKLPLHVRAPRHRVEEIRAHLQSVLEEAVWHESFMDSLERFSQF